MKKLVGLLVLVMVVSGCAVTPKLTLGMAKQEVLTKCGTPKQSGTMQDKNGQILESFIYDEGFWSPNGGVVTHVYFADDKVIYYGSNPGMPIEESEK